MSDQRTPLEYAIDWMEQQAWRNRNYPISIRHGVATRQQAAADAIREMQAQLASVIAERDALLQKMEQRTSSDYSASLFAPFDADGILCVQDGKIVANPDDERDWTEYHIEHMHGDVWRIERCDAAELCSFVYQGQIPDRDFFVALMRNQETPLPEAALRGEVQP